MEQPQKKTIFVVEHMEPFLFEWCLYEYLSMKNFLQHHNTGLWITNAASFYEYEGEKVE